VSGGGNPCGLCGLPPAEHVGPVVSEVVEAGGQSLDGRTWPSGAVVPHGHFWQSVEATNEISEGPRVVLVLTEQKRQALVQMITDAIEGLDERLADERSANPPYVTSTEAEATIKRAKADLYAWVTEVEQAQTLDTWMDTWGTVDFPPIPAAYDEQPSDESDGHAAIVDWAAHNLPLPKADAE
jgi:hypothetical protein